MGSNHKLLSEMSVYDHLSDAYHNPFYRGLIGTGAALSFGITVGNWVANIALRAHMGALEFLLLLLIASIGNGALMGTCMWAWNKLDPAHV